MSQARSQALTSRRTIIAAGAATAATAAFLPATLSANRMRVRQASGDVSIRFFPFGPGVEELYAAFADEFMAENPDITVNLDLQPWDNRYPKLLADVAAGQGPDAFFITTDVLIRFAEAEAIAPLTDLISPDLFAAYDTRYTDEVSLDGAIWFVPYDQEVPLHVANLDILEQVGLDETSLPATWDDVVAMCKAVQELGDDNLYGFGYPAAATSLNTSFYSYLMQAGGQPISDDGLTATFNSPAGVEALTYITELFANNWSSQEYLQPIDEGLDPFTLGSQALSNSMFVAGLLQLRQNAPDMRYAIGPILTYKEQLGFGGMRSWAINEKSGNKEAAALLLEFLARPENAKRHGEAFGTFPALSEAREGIFSDDPEIAGLTERLDQIFGEQKHKYGRDLMPLVVPEIQAAIIGAKEPQQALDDAAAAVDELFAQG